MNAKNRGLKRIAKKGTVRANELTESELHDVAGGIGAMSNTLLAQPTTQLQSTVSSSLQVSSKITQLQSSSSSFYTVTRTFGT